VNRPSLQSYETFLYLTEPSHVFYQQIFICYLTFLTDTLTFNKLSLKNYVSIEKNIKLRIYTQIKP